MKKLKRILFGEPKIKNDPLEEAMKGMTENERTQYLLKQLRESQGPGDALMEIGSNGIRITKGK